MDVTLPLLRGIVVNLVLLLGFVSLLTLLEQRFLRPSPTLAVRWQGALHGVMAVLVMLVPVQTSPGVIFDCRGAVIGSGALLGGPVVALISLPFPIAYRVCLGGTGVPPGILEVLFPALFGSLANFWFRRCGWSWSPGRTFLAAVVVAVASFVGLYLLIRTFAPGTKWDIGWNGVLVLTAISALAMGLVTSLVSMERGHWQAVKVMHESERRLLHSQKMVALGQLAGNVAHEFLNCLATVLGNAQLAKKKVAGMSDVEPLLDEIVATAKNASRLSSQLLAFSQPRPLRKRLMEVSKCVAGIEQILTKALGPGIKVVQHLDAEAGMAEIDPDLIEQAIVTIALARAEAMHGYGCLTVEVSPARLSSSESQRLQAGVSEAERHKGPFVLLSIEDTAKDITPEVAMRFFEPFFMAKNGKKKGGLELATAYNIIRQHGGHIEVRVVEERGTRFLIYLPVVSASA